MMLFLERDEDVCSCGAGGSRAVVDVVEGAVRKTKFVEDVVHLGRWNCLPDTCFNLIRKTRSFFNAGSCLRSYMQNELAAVGIREKILTKKRNESEGQYTDDNKAWNKGT